MNGRFSGIRSCLIINSMEKRVAPALKAFPGLVFLFGLADLGLLRENFASKSNEIYENNEKKGVDPSKSLKNLNIKRFTKSI